MGLGMVLKIGLPETTQLEDGIWRCSVEPSELRRLGEPSTEFGDRSVLLVSGAEYDNEKCTLEFNVEDATLLNIGASSDLVVVRSGDPDGQRAGHHQSRPLFRRGSGDRQFLAELLSFPKTVRDSGQVILQKVRSRFPGDLKRFPRNRYVEQPDNFWAVTLQPREQTLLVTVRGEPAQFNVPEGMDLKLDRRGYSAFKVRDIRQIEGAVSLIGQARRRRMR